MKRLIFIVPIAAFAALAYVLFNSLLAPPPEVIPSMLVGKPAPTLTLPALDAATEGFGPAQLKAGHVSVVNVFGSWCVECAVEAPNLSMLAHLPGVAFYGLVYKDTPQKARAYLNRYGDPFERIGLDESGEAGIEWGVYGAPETFVIDGKGIVRLRHAGPLSADIIKSEILPAIAAARASS